MRRPPTVAGLAVVALATAAVLIWSPWESGGDPVLDDALAALDDGPVLHTVVRERGATAERYAVDSGRPVVVESEYESWVDPERNRIHAVEHSDGWVVRDELIGTDGLERAQTTAKLVVDLRERLERDELQVVREGTIAGRAVHWLGLESAPEGVRSYEAAVDTTTDRVVRIQTLGGHFQAALDFARFEALARDEADFEAGSPAVLDEERRDTRLADARAAARVVEGAQWVGDRLGDLPLRRVGETTWRATLRPGGDLRGAIVKIAYGDSLASEELPTGLEIVQAADDDPARRFLRPAGVSAAPPPAGTFDLTSEFGSTGTRVQALLRKGRVWLVVRASSRALVFETVRQLRPIRRGAP